MRREQICSWHFLWKIKRAWANHIRRNWCHINTYFAKLQKAFRK